ncbi:MAG: glycosyltransferase [Dermatophilus congolensis]|nr:glycosyltransferase [Dermatophilus congolensis]
MRPSAPVTVVVVAIPARDEEMLLGGCLAGVLASAEVLRVARPHVHVEVVVALDRCTDASAQVASTYPVVTVATESTGVGPARDLAVRTGLARTKAPPAATWIACTDADTVVPAHWLLTQLEFADQGAELVVGTVEPNGEVDPLLLRRWHDRHQLVEGHPHIHGANLGLRASTWALLGGFGEPRSHEDVRLVARARIAGVAVSATDRTRVSTSARRIGRVDDGFAAYLAAMT